MKKLRLIALLLALLMTVAVFVPALSLVTFAGEEETPFPDKPATLPGADIRKWDWYKPRDGIVANGTALPYPQFNAKYTTQMLIDFTQLSSDQVQSSDDTKPAYCGPEGVQGKQNTKVSLTDGLPEEYSHVWRGASGLLIEVDTTIADANHDIVTAGAGWHLRLIAETTRVSLSQSQPTINNVIFASSVNSIAGWQSYYYVYSATEHEFECASGAGVRAAGKNRDYFEEGSWNCEIVPSTNARIVDNFRGYIYLPFDCSFFCLGADAAGTYERSDVMTFNEAAQIYEDIKITNIEINNAWSANGAFFRNIQLVFAEPAYSASEDMEVESLDGEVTMTAPSTPATLDQSFSLIGADGFRFNVDTTGVDAPVQLRMTMTTDTRLNASRWAEGYILSDFVETPGIEWNEELGVPVWTETGEPVDPELIHTGLTTGPEDEEILTYPIWRGDETETKYFGKNTTLTLTSDEFIKTISRGYDCLMFYFDEEGNPVPLTSTGETDIFAALPLGYKGEIYIPVSSFYGLITETLQVPIIDAGLMNYTSIAFTYESTGTGNVTISNVDVCLTDATIAGASFSMGDDLALHVYANADPRYANVTMEFYCDNKLVNSNILGVLVDEDTNLYRFTVENISLYRMDSLFDATLRLNSERTSVQIKNYSFVKYASNVIGADGVSAEMNTFLTNLVYYGDALQQYKAAKDAAEQEPPVEGEEPVEPEPLVLFSSYLSDEQKGFRTESDITLNEAVTTFEGEFDKDYEWQEAEVDFSEGSLVLDLRAYLTDEIGIACTITAYEEEYAVDSSKWGVRGGLFVIRTAMIPITDFVVEVTAYLAWEGDLYGQIITTSYNAALKSMIASPYTTAEQKVCAQNLYDLSVSAAALVNG